MISSVSRRWALYGLLAWLVLLPLPFGANRTWALALVLPWGFLLAAAVAWSRPVTLSLPAFLLRPPGLLLLAFVAVIAAQLIPWNGPPLSVVPHQTAVYLLTALACTVAFWLVTAVVRSDTDLRLLLGGLVVCGLVQAVIAVGLLASGASLSFLDSEIRRQGVATGTFVNRNNFAAYLNIALAAGIGLMVGQLGAPRPGRHWTQRLRDAIELLLGGKARLRLVLVMLVIVLIATRSRMGNASFFFALMVAASVYAVFSRERRRGLLIFVGSVIVIDLVLIGAWVGVDRVVERIQQTPLRELTVSAPSAGTPEAGAPAAAPPQAAAPPAVRDPRLQQSVEARIEPALDALKIVREHPWLGTGAGTFYLVYMAYQPNWDGYYNHAHNDYLEIATDTGLLGLGALMALALYSLGTALGILRTRQHPMLRAAAFAALMSIAAMAAHATVDFNLQMPAIAITFTVMVALPFAARQLQSRRRETDEPLPMAQTQEAGQ